MQIQSASAPRFGFHRFAAPPEFYRLAGQLIPWFSGLAALLAALGLYLGFFVAPTDAQQGEVYRIIFIHVPASWMAMFIYAVMAFWSGIGIAFNTRMSSMWACAMAPTGALMAFIALVTGALWGEPAWGTYFKIQDPRMMSTLILLFLYVGFMALHGAIDDPRRADRAAGVLVLVGVVNLPIIYFSVQWWNSLHQGASVSLTKAPSMAKTMLEAMLVMSIAFWMYSIAISLARVRAVLLERERRSSWAREEVSMKSERA